MAENRIEHPSDLNNRPSYHESLDFSRSNGRQFRRILAAYRFPKDAYVRCGISSCHTPHGSGYLVETSDGLETNIGNVCGAKHFGADFKLERSRFEAWERRQRNLQVIEGFQHQVDQHQGRVDKAIQRANAFWRFTRELGNPEVHALKAMAKERQERLDSEDRLSREDAKALHQAQQVHGKFTRWYREQSPKVKDLGLRFPGVTAMMYPFREVLVEQLQQPMNQLMALGMQEIESLDNKQLDEWRQQIQAAPRLMREAETALDNAATLMAVDRTLFRFLPGVYEPAEDQDI